MCEPSLICMKFSPLKFFSKFLLLILQEHGSLVPPRRGNSSIVALRPASGRSSALHGPLLLSHAHPSSGSGSSMLLQPGASGLPPAFPPWSPLAPLSLPRFASCPTGKTEPSACWPFDSINASAPTPPLTSQMPECPPALSYGYRSNPRGETGI